MTKDERLAEARALLAWSITAAALAKRTCDDQEFSQMCEFQDGARAWLAHDDTPATVDTGEGHIPGLRGDDGK